jgi:hypothetical protein
LRPQQQLPPPDGAHTPAADAAIAEPNGIDVPQPAKMP